jgi:GNAT superfamily N-acetyltransferase
MADSAAWTLDGIAPPDNTYRDAGEEPHRAFWRFIGKKGEERFRWRCNQGLDKDGVPLTPIRESTRRKGRWRSHTGRGSADHPPLVPALGLSRFEELLTSRGFVDHAEWYWTTDPVSGRHWGQVALWHAQGAGLLPVRNVIGWSKADIAWLRQEGATWWYAYQHGQRVAAAAAVLQLPFDRQPQRIAVVGRTDIEYATFGIGADRERTARAIEEGFHTGFRQLPPRGRTGGRQSPRPVPAAEPPLVKVAAMKPASPPKKAPAAKPLTPVPAPAPAKPSPVTFGPSTARVSADATSLRLLKEFTGRDFVAQDVASLVGATHDAEVVAYGYGRGDWAEVTVQIRSPRYHSNRTIKVVNGKPIIHNDLLVVEAAHRGAGLGAQILGRQVEHASKWGFDRLETDAARSNGPDGYVGYYAWPRLGYNAAIPADVKRKLPAAWSDAVTVRDLMKTPERRAWWKEHGVWTNGMIFRLQPGSESMQDLQMNLAESQSKKPK